MTSRLVQLHPDALSETEAAIRWYRQRSPRAAEAFLAEIERALDAISEAPDRWPPTENDWRRFSLRRFPFSVVYRETPEQTIMVLAIAHGRRKPGYWRKREL
jgi:plasmid stabilization system protein ParE